MLDIIVNPNARKGKIKRLIAEVEKKLKAEGAAFCFHFSEREGGIREHARRLSEAGECTLVAMGGDGTLNELISGISDPARVTVGLIPAGTGNDFAEAAHIPGGLKALDLILHGEAKYTDYLECGEGLRSINIAGLGIDVDILERCSRMRGTQRSKYFFSLLASLCKYKPIKLKVTVDGETKEYSSLIAAACNGKQFGGGIPFCPEAEVDDGLIDLAVVDCPKRIRIPFELMRLMKGKLMSRPIAHRVRCTQAEIVPEIPCKVQLDGELVEIEKLSVKVVSGTLKMFRG